MRETCRNTLSYRQAARLGSRGARVRQAIVGGLMMGTICARAPAASTALATSGRWDSIASGSGNVLFLAAGTLLPLAEDGREGRQITLRVADAALSATLASQGLKMITRERRPDADSRDSFPSGHATAVFAVATVESHYHPKQAPLWYLGASVISASRVTLHRHYVHDVLVGAALGYGVARLELSRPRGLLLTPFISSDGGGLTLTGSF